MKSVSKIILPVLFLAANFTAFSQKLFFKQNGEEVVISRLGDIIPDSVTLRGSMQGMAICRNHAYLLRDKGQCIVIDLKRKKFVTEFMLPENNSHCNNASFGKGRKPLLYVSECFGEKRCKVTDVFSPERKVVQTIHYNTPYFAQDWCIDADNGFIYAYTGIRGGEMFLKRFLLPSADSSVIEYHDTDLLEQITVKSVKVAQGSKIYRGHAFLPDGDEAGNYFLHVIDIKSKQEVYKLNLNHIGCEPEGVDIKGKWLYISFNTPIPQENKIYRFRIRQNVLEKKQ